MVVDTFAIAAARAAPGPRETHGTMAKNLVAACAAEEGLFAAFLARAGVLAPAAPIEGKRGLGVLVAEGADYAAMTAGLGQSFELMRNAYKPYPCGIVAHAAITGALALARDHAPAPAAIRAVRLAVHPLCLELCGRRAPQDRVEGTFSVYHWVAVALIDRAIFIRQFSDATVADPAVVALRDRVEARAEPRLRKDEAEIELTLADGTVLRHHVDHAAGSIERPPSDADLDAKLADLVAGVCRCRRAPRRSRRLCWRASTTQPDAAAILAERPSPSLRPARLRLANPTQPSPPLGRGKGEGELFRAVRTFPYFAGDAASLTCWLVGEGKHRARGYHGLYRR